jgi:hypothetical protein
VAIASRYITAEIEGRSIELLGSRLLPRRCIVLTPYLFIVVSIVCVYTAMLFGSFSGRFFLDLNDDIKPFVLIKIVGIGLLFFIAISAIVLYIAVLFSERGTAIAWGTGVILIAFVYDAIIRLWQQIDFLKPYSLFNWYQPVNITTNQYDYVVGIPLLLFLTILFLFLSLRHFNRRDL